MNTPTLRTVDFDAILQRQMEEFQLEERCERLKESLVDLAHVLSELRTVGFHAPRQSGKSWWVGDKLIEDPNAVVVVVNEKHQEMMLRHVGLSGKGRVLTSRDVINESRRITAWEPEPESYVSRVYVDESHHISRALSDAKLYQWAAWFNNPEMVVVKIC